MSSNKKETKFSTHLLSGAFSGGFVSVLTQPFDVVKTNMIGSSENQISGKRTNTIQQIKLIYKQSGIKGFWKGTIPTIYRVVPGAGIYYSMIHYFSMQKKKYKNEMNFLDNFSIGFFSRFIATFILSPVTLIKTRFEFYPSNIGFVETLKSIWRVEGLRGLWRGVTPSILRDAPYSGILFSEKLNLHVDSVYNQLISSSIAAILSTSLTHPFDVIRTKAQLQNDTKFGIFEITKNVYKNEGIESFLRGLTPRLLKRGFHSAIVWTSYEQIVKLFN
eukprot:gene3538-6273_t